MTLLVHKYGGTSVADLERIRRVAERIQAARAHGARLVVVLSAMSGETDRMLAMAHALVPKPSSRELDVLLATGEQASIALLSMYLESRGCPARSYTGAQVRIRTDAAFGKARIAGIERARIETDLAEGRVVVVAGFQGVDEEGNITTLGRGGSDTTAVALAAALGADECRIYTDVDGVYTSDPRIVPEARRLSEITFDEMLELASLGAKVLQIRAVEFASKYRVPLRVLSSFAEGEGGGTRIVSEEDAVEHPVIAGVAFSRDEAKITVLGVPDRPGIAASLLGPVAGADIEVDMIVQNVGEQGLTDFTFTVNRGDFPKTLTLVRGAAAAMGAREVTGDTRIAKISLVGVGMRSHAGIASRMFAALAADGINIQIISTSEIKISVVVDERYLELGVRSLHDAFELGEKASS